MKKFISIAIDGPAGSGKTTIAKLLSEKLGFLHLNTGSMYRAMAYYYIKNNIDFEDEKQVEKHIGEINIDIRYENGKQADYLNGEYVTPFLREERVSYGSSFVSQFKAIREKATFQQRKIAENMNVIVEGRDIGSKVLPNADYKFFLTATSEERAKRRYKENLEKNIECSFEEILKTVKERDVRDSTREISPLVKAEDAILVDSTNLSISQVVDFMMSYIK